MFPAFPSSHLDDVVAAIQEERRAEHCERLRRWWRALPLIIVVTIVLDCVALLTAFDERLMLLLLERGAAPIEWRQLSRPHNPLLSEDKSMRFHLGRRALLGDFRRQVLHQPRAQVLATWGPDESDEMKSAEDSRSKNIMYLLGRGRGCCAVWAVLRFDANDIAIAVDEVRCGA